MARKKDVDWNNGPLSSSTEEQATRALLMDIRDELKRLNNTLDCHRFQRIPTELKQLNQRLLKHGLKLR